MATATTATSTAMSVVQLHDDERFAAADGAGALALAGADDLPLFAMIEVRRRGGGAEERARVGVQGSTLEWGNSTDH